MFEDGDKVYYIDIVDGTILEGRFIEQDHDGIWIRINGQTVNTFVYSDLVDERVFKEKPDAEAGFESLRSRMKARLLENNNFIDDIASRLSKHEGQFYVSIIREILSEIVRHNF